MDFISWPPSGTEVRDKHEEYGIRILTSDWDRYDANQAVSETDFIPHEEIERIVKNFGKKYVDKLVENIHRYELGEKVSEEQETSIKHLKNFVFVRDLIAGEHIEGFNGSANGLDRNEAMSALASHIASQSKYKKEEALSHLKRLLDLNCIDVRQDARGTSVVWA